MVKTSEISSTSVIMLRSPHHTGYTEAANYLLILKYLSYSISYDLGHVFDERTNLLYSNEDMDENDERLVEMLSKIVGVYKELAKDNELLSYGLFNLLFFSNPLHEEFQLQQADCNTLLFMMRNFPDEGEEYDFGVIPLKYFDPTMSLSANRIRMILQDCVVMDEPLILRAGEVPSDAYEMELEPESKYYS
mgnify:CR=1 FL=1